MSQFRHGVRIIEDTSGPRNIRLGRTSIFGLVGTAPDSQAALAAQLIINESDGPANDNGLQIDADVAGSNGNAISIALVDPGENSSPLSISVNGNAITVSLATDGGGVITSTADDVLTAVNADGAAGALVTVSDYSTSDGSGLVAALSRTNLTGGEDEPFPLNTPVLITSADTDKINKLGTAGTLFESLDELFTVTGATGVVVRVAVGVDDAATQANVTGNSITRTGWHALRDAQAEVGVKPKILLAPYFTNVVGVASEGLSVAAMLKAIILIDGPNTTDAAAQTYAENFGQGRNPVIDPWIKVQADDGSIVERPASARVAGVKILNDRERGFWFSSSNRPIPGIVGTSRPIDYSLDDPDSRATILNENNVTTIIKLDSGFVLWGNRSNSADPKYSFLSVRRTADLINEAIQDAHVWAVDQNITTEYFESVIQSVNQFMRRMESIGAILGGECWADAELNTPENLAAGKVFFNYDFNPNSPAEDITFQYSITDRYFAEIFG